MVVANPYSGGPVLLAQAGRDGLTNFKFLLEAPWKACRLCGSVYQSELDRQAYQLEQDGEHYDASTLYLKAVQRRQRWAELHNRRRHPNYENEVATLHRLGLPVTPEA